MSQRSKAALFFATLLLLILHFSLPKNFKPLAPKEGGQVLLISNTTGNDLSKTMIHAINSARKSIFLSIFNISDNKVISALNQKANEGVQISLYTDAHASWPGIKLLDKQIKMHLWKTGALMHQKILVIDKEEVYLGSANFSWNSLNVHRNLILAFKNDDAAHFIVEHLECSDQAHMLSPCKTINIGSQEAEIWMLPSSQDLAKRVISLMEGAKKTIRVAMFTWTRDDFAEVLVKSALKGVHVEVICDRSNGKKTPNSCIDILSKAGINPYIYQGPGLLHHKFLWIDGEALLSGSANWTKAAFTKNRESCVLLKNLTETQKQVMNSLWESLKKESIYSSKFN